MKLRAFLLLSLAVGLSACFSLDPFLYTPPRVDHYDLNLDGGTPDLKLNPDQVELVQIPEDGGITLWGVHIQSSIQPPITHVLFMHGKGSTFAKEFDNAKRFANMGFEVLEIDYRGFGMSSDVEPTEDGIGLDTRTARQWFIDHGAPPERTFIYGHSFGTATATQLAEAEPPYMLVLESSFASIRDFETDVSSLDFPTDFIAKSTWDTKGRVSRMHVPLLLIHGLADYYIRPEFSKEIYAASPNPADKKQLILVPGAAHNDSPEKMGPAFAETLLDWVSRFQP